MRPKKLASTPLDLFQTRLTNIIDERHPLLALAAEIDWDWLDGELGSSYADVPSRPGLPTRLMVGLHYLKHAYNESDESVVARWIENPYWQFFCGFEYFQTELPLDPSSMTRWRQRVGDVGVERLLHATIQAAKHRKLITPKEVSKVIVDTTVQEKAITFPTDTRLYNTARSKLVREAKRRGIVLRQTYERVGKRALLMHGRYRHSRKYRKAKREQRRLRTYLGRVIRDIRRKCPCPDDSLETLLTLAERIYTQQRHDTKKLYSLHAPEVECIAKGKAKTKYEFGCKVSFVTTSKSNWIVGAMALHGNPYDGHTLGAALAQTERLTEFECQDVYVDRGYRGKAVTSLPYDVHRDGQKRKTQSRSARKWMRRRSAIEPIIGHVKQDHRMGRNFLKGEEGDRQNALLAAAGFNIRKLLRAFLCPHFGGEAGLLGQDFALIRSTLLQIVHSRSGRRHLIVVPAVA